MDSYYSRGARYSHKTARQIVTLEWRGGAFIGVLFCPTCSCFLCKFWPRWWTLCDVTGGRWKREWIWKESAARWNKGQTWTQNKHHSAIYSDGGFEHSSVWQWHGDRVALCVVSVHSHGSDERKSLGWRKKNGHATTATPRTIHTPKTALKLRELIPLPPSFSLHFTPSQHHSIRINVHVHKNATARTRKRLEWNPPWRRQIALFDTGLVRATKFVLFHPVLFHAKRAVE